MAGEVRLLINETCGHNNSLQKISARIFLSDLADEISIFEKKSELVRNYKSMVANFHTKGFEVAEYIR